MDEEQKRKILSFLSRCQNDEMSQTSNIAKYLGLEQSRCVLSLLRQMESEGLVRKTGRQWQLYRDGSPPNAAPGCGGTGDQSEVVSPVPAANHLPGLAKVTRGRSWSTGQPELTAADDDDDGVTSQLSTLDVEETTESNDTECAGDESLKATRGSKISEYDIIRLIGHGGYGYVFEVQRRTMDKQSYALKIVKLQDSERVRERVMREVNVMARLNHNNIVRYYDSWFDNCAPDFSQIHTHPSIPTVGNSTNTSLRSVKPSASVSSVSGCDFGRGSPYTVASTLSASNVTYLYIRMELCQPRTLKDWLDKHREHRPLEDCIAIFKEVVTAVDYLHKQNCMHRDIKPQNILFDERTGQVKVSDFGLATVITEGTLDVSDRARHDDSLQRTTRQGTEMYMSPEQKTADYDNKVDIYALGLLLVEIFCPFKTEYERIESFTRMRCDADVKTRRSVITLPAKFTSDFPRQTNLVRSMLSHDPSQRPTTQEILLELKQLKTRRRSPPANNTA